LKSSSPFIFLAVLFFACSKPVAEIPVDTALKKKLNAYLAETVERLNVAGLTVAITRNDSVIYSAAFGYRNIETKERLTPYHVFHWASVSKTFVATAIMQLWEQKKIDLDEKLTTYLPYFRQQDEFYKDITIRQMLNHTSGIGDVDDYEWDKPQYDSGALERFVRGIANDKMLFAPGKDMRYSNTAFETLGDVIAKISGMSFETYVRKNILDPLEMNITSFLYPEIPDSLRVSGHEWAGMPIVSKYYPYNRRHGPSSTLNSNVLEMTHYAFAHLNRGIYKGERILADSTYDLWWTNSVNLENKSEIGLAWWLSERNGLKLVSHSGGDTGFRSFFLLVPEKNISIMLVSNYELLRTDDLAAAILDILMDIDPLPGRRQIGFKFAEVMKAEGIDAAKAFFEKTNADSVQRRFYLFDEDDAAFAYPGYLFMNHEMYPDAIEMFKFNVEQFPNSGWAHAHLATVHAKSGDKVLARLHFKKAIELSPDERSFKEELNKLGR
jgi:CubicO group peptidase (beta-lactamase class C family)